MAADDLPVPTAPPRPKRAHGRSLADFRIKGATTPHGLLPGEENLLAAVAKGEECRLGYGRPETATDANRIRAPFLRFLALGGDEDATVHEKGIELFGAYIEGELDLEGCQGVVPLGLWDCWLDGELVLRDARLRMLNLGGSRVPGLQGDRVKVDGGVHLRQGFLAEGMVRLLGAEIGGQLSCTKGTFRNRSDDGSGLALDFGRARIGGSVFLSDGFTAEGGVRLNGAEIGGDFACAGGTFDNGVPDAALSESLPTAARALYIAGATVKGATFFGPAGPPNDKPVTIRGSVDLQGARLGDLVDHPESWPPATILAPDGKTKLACVIGLDGLTYTRLVGGGKYDAATRKKWLARQPYKHRVADFRPQPYEQLVKVLREMGHEADARAIAKHKQAMWRRAELAKLWGKLKGILRRPERILTIPARMAWLGLGWLVIGLLAGYGYGKKRLIAMAAIVTIACAFVYEQAAEQGLMAPTSPVVFTNETLRARCEANWTTCPSLPREHASFSPHLYSFDTLLPIVDLGIGGQWSPVFEEPNADAGKKGSGLRLSVPSWLPYADRVPEVTMPPSFLRTVHWGQVIAGWALSLLIVAVLSGLMKQD